MTAYLRTRISGATYFFTLALQTRGATTLIDGISHLREAYQTTYQERPFVTDAIVVLPDHLHAVWTLPPGDSDFGIRWGAIKSRFTRSMKAKMGWNPILRSASKASKGDAGLWQRRFWEHAIRDETDLETHLRYCWGNPVKHGFVERPADWPFSSIHREIAAGRIEPEWSDKSADGNFGE